MINILNIALMILAVVNFVPNIQGHSSSSPIWECKLKESDCGLSYGNFSPRWSYGPVEAGNNYSVALYVKGTSQDLAKFVITSDKLPTGKFEGCLFMNMYFRGSTGFSVGFHSESTYDKRAKRSINENDLEGNWRIDQTYLNGSFDKSSIEVIAFILSGAESMIAIDHIWIIKGPCN